MATRKGDTLLFASPPCLEGWGAVGGKKEGEGPLAAQFDLLYTDNSLGLACWEEAESEMQRQCAELTLQKAHLPLDKLSLVLAGDLQNQCTAAGYAMQQLSAPFAGVYGACSTMAETLGLAACLASAGLVDHAMAMASSHFCTAERQFRTPLEYGGKRTPTAQWTATAAGCCLVTPAGAGPQVRAVTFGRVQDLAVTDINNMGAAMAPAAAATLLHYLQDTGAQPEEFDTIYTGDLGKVGSALFLELMEQEGLPLQNHADCGLLLYEQDTQTVQAGGSGAGCSASVLCGSILPGLQRGKEKRVLFMATGALMSQTTFLQKKTIPGIAHLLELAAPEAEGEQAR